jgi:hypothetical protein
MRERRSPRVRRILDLQGRAAAFQAKFESAMVRIAPTRHHAEQLRQQALSLRVRLTREELCHLLLVVPRDISLCRPQLTGRL